MLFIRTDITRKNWLVYLFEEFCRINRAEFTVKVVGLSESVPETADQLFYVADLKGLHDITSIPNRSQDKLKSTFVDCENRIKVLEGTKSEDERFIIGYDILWNAFVLLSRLEEFLTAKNGKQIHSYAARHPYRGKQVFERPLVNELFNELEKLIRHNFPQLKFDEDSKRTIELSHDLDYIEKTAQLRIKQTAFNAFNTLKSIGTPSRFGANLKKTFGFLFSNPSYWRFDYWMDLEESFDMRSVFYVYSKGKSGGLGTWLLDPSYDVGQNQRLQAQLKGMLDKGFEIGLHGSYFSANNEDLLADEKQQLEKAIDRPVVKTRQHWLRYFEDSTPSIHEKLFEFNSTVGWNDLTGFRAFCCSRYRPYNHEEDRPFKHFVTPQVLMDSHLFDYSSDGSEESWQNVQNMLVLLKEFKNVHVAVSWHPRTCSEDYNWHHRYEQLLPKLNELATPLQ